MKSIGGNITAYLQIKNGTSKNAIGEVVPEWTTLHTLNGFLDYQSGDAKYTNFNAKIQESTHVFVCDYISLDERIKAENSRLIVNNKHYDIVLIDNPMELNYQLEIYLTFTGD